MSRTDAHRPYDVWVNDPYNRHLTYLVQYWPTDEPHRHTWVRLHAAKSDQVLRKLTRRSERVQWNIDARNIVKLVDREDVDVAPPIHSSRGWW
jgi:hypothetical protein